MLADFLALGRYRDYIARRIIMQNNSILFWSEFEYRSPCLRLETYVEFICLS